MAASAGGEIDVLGIGNAIVDVLAHADESLLATHGLAKGTMTLIDETQAKAIYQDMGPGTEISGGSAANTMVGVASFGGRAAYIGKVRNDQLGEVFSHDIRASGVRFRTAPAEDGAATARCLVLVTADAQRTMNTYLGACVDLGPEDIDVDLVGAARVTYLEGYLWDPPKAKDAFRKAAEVAHGAGREVALTLSDPFCVDRHRADFLDLVEHHVDILFANEAEITALYQVDTFDEACTRVRAHCPVAALTRSAAGSIIVTDGQVHEVEAAPVDRVLDTTGAGDLYAAGFLFGYTKGYDLPTAGRLGSLAAAEVISHIGARPEVSLMDLATDHLH